MPPRSVKFSALRGHEREQRLRFILNEAVIDASSLALDPKFYDEVTELATRLYLEKKSSDDRGQEEIKADTFVGELGERAIVNYVRLIDGYDSCVHNVEEHTREYHWDFLYKFLKCEVKYQSSHHSCFSFSRKLAQAHLEQNWSKIDLIVAFYVYQPTVEQVFVVPWLLIDAEALAPGLDLYRDSLHGDGKFLKSHAEVLGYFVHLNKKRK